MEGFVLMPQGPVDLSFYPVADQPRITALLEQYGILYTIEIAKYYDDKAAKTIAKVYRSSLSSCLCLCFHFY